MYVYFYTSKSAVDLNLGAKAVLLGRPILYGLAVNGEMGATHVLSLLRDELVNVMQQCGCFNLDEITKDLLVAISQD